MSDAASSDASYNPLEDHSPLPDVAPVTVPGSSLGSWMKHETDVPTQEQSQFATDAELRVLVVESDVETADRVIEILESSGYRVEIATDATYGLMLAEQFQPNLIVLGVVSERMSGADFTRMLQKSPGFMGRAHMTPILYLLDNKNLIQQRFHGLRDTPLNEAVLKPVDAAELLEKAARVIAQYQHTSS